MVRISLEATARPASTQRSVGEEPARHRTRTEKRYSRLNSVTGQLLVLLVLVSAVPVASNRPAWWLIWTLLLGLGGLLYLAQAHFLTRGRRALQISQFPLFTGLALLVPVYAVVQFLPLAHHLPLALQSLPAAVPDALQPASLSVMPGASLLGAIRAAGFMVFLVLVIEVGTQSKRTHYLGLILMSGIALHGVFGLIALRLLDDYSVWGTKEVYRGMLTGTFVNRNSIATFLGFGLVLALAFAMQRGHQAASAGRARGHGAVLTLQWMEVLGLCLAFGLLALMLLMTQSRMGVIATSVGIFVTFLVMRLTLGASASRIATEAAFGILIGLAFLISADGTALLDRVLLTFVESTDRLNLYAQTWGMILQRPLTGFGYDAFGPAFELYRDEPLVSQHSANLAHNTYLALWAEQGLVIGSLPMLLTAWAAVSIIRRLRKGDGDIAVNAAALGAITLGALHSLADFSLEIPANVYCFLLIVGLAIAPPRLAQTGANPVRSAPGERG